MQPCNQTKLGKKVIRFFKGHTGLNGYNSEQDILDKQHTEPILFKRIKKIFQQFLKGFDQNATEEVV